MATSDELALPIDPGHLPRAPLPFVFSVARAKYRWWIALLLLGEAINASCGILLPFALGRILTKVTAAPGTGAQATLQTLQGPLALFAVLCLGELIFGRVNSAIQLRVTPRQRQYVARAMFRYLHGHSQRFLTENFSGSLANRIAETSHGVNQVMWAVVTVARRSA